jgi:rubrerythrin
MTGESLTASDVLDTAWRLEEAGERFYRLASERADDARVAQLLGQLAEMEKDHQQVFQAVKTHLVDEAAPGVEMPDYLTALADERVFEPADAEEIASSGSLGAVVDKAILLENDSILFYLGIKEMFCTAEARDAVQEVIAQEMAHVTSLRNLAGYLRQAPSSGS